MRRYDSSRGREGAADAVSSALQPNAE